MNIFLFILIRFYILENISASLLLKTPYFQMSMTSSRGVTTELTQYWSIEQINNCQKTTALKFWGN